MSLRLLPLFALICPLITQAATTTVQVGYQSGNTFFPATAVIQAGDTVQWTWVNGGHSTTSDTGLWDSGIHNTPYPAGFSRQFTTAGSFPYHCRVHGTMMSGTITVTAAPTPTPTPTPTATPTPTPTPTPFSQHPLMFPPVSTAANIPISIDEACVQILDGPCTYMWTYGGTYPGLTIRRPTGQSTSVTFTNNLDPLVAPSLSVHNHGNHTISLDDGYVTGSQYLFAPGTSRTYVYDETADGGNARGTMHYYHDHRIDETGMTVWMGLEALYIIDDATDPTSLPSGSYELPLALSDRQFDGNNQLSYFFDPAGVYGETMLVNGVYQPYLDVGDRKYRLRILNGSNARIYDLTLSTDIAGSTFIQNAFMQIGTESGLMPSPLTRSAMIFGPAERLDVVIDFTGKYGQEIYLMDADTVTPLLKFRVNQHVADTSTVPATLRPLPDIGTPTVTRNFRFDQTSGHWTINSQAFDANRIDAHPQLGATERWIFTNPTSVVHMVHIHDVDQQCLSRDGGACYPWEPMKETWYLGPGETIELKMRFSDHTGKYMFHCHILEHEDDGMMSQFEVVTPVTLSQTVSRELQGSQTYDAALSGTECRSGGASGNYTVVFKFTNSLTSVGSANVTAGTGSVASARIDSTDARNYIVNLTGVANAQRLMIGLTNVQDSAGNFNETLSAQMNVLIGDTNGDGVVNSADISQTKAQSGAAVAASNWRQDVTADGLINSADVSLVKSKSGTALP